MNSNAEERRAGVGDDNASAIISTQLQDERQGIILEAFEIIQNEAVLGLEEKKKDLAKYLTSLQEAITARKEWRSCESCKNLEEVLGLAAVVLGENSLLIGNLDVRYHTTPIEEIQSTGMEALPIILNSTKDVLQNIRLLKMENYYLTEYLVRLILQDKLDDAIGSLTAHKYYDGWMHRPQYSSDHSIRLSHITTQLETEIRASNDNKLVVQAMNSKLRELLSELTGIESDTDGRDKMMSIDFDSEYPNYELSVASYSVGVTSEDVQDLIRTPLLKMENKALAERAKSEILYLRFKMVMDNGYGRPFAFTKNVDTRSLTFVQSLLRL